MLLKELKESLVVEGARTRLRELEEEREALLKILGIPFTDKKGNHIDPNGNKVSKAGRVLITAKAIRAHSTKPTIRRSGWSKKRLAKFRATMKRKYGEPSQWPSTKAVRGLS
jgi:hypothetical protein